MASSRRTATVLFLDIVGSTRIASDLGDARFRELISRFNRIVSTNLRRDGGREEDRAGDGFFATFAEPAHAIRCACHLSEDVRELGIEIRIGIHTGETERVDGKTQGIAVVIGSRAMSLASAGDILVSNTTKELATGAGFTFEDFAAHELKGVPGLWQLWAVTEADGTPRPGPMPAADAAERLRAIEGVRPERGKRRRLAIAGFASAAVVAGGLALLLPRGEQNPGQRSQPTALASGTLIEIDPAGHVESMIPLRPLQEARTSRHTAHPLAVGEGGVWVVRRDQLIHVDPIDGEEVGRSEIGRGNPLSINIASGYDAIWLMIDRELLRVHPTTAEVHTVASVNRGPGVSWTTDVSVGAGYVWAGTSDGELIRYDPRTGSTVRATLAISIDAIAAGTGGVWMSDLLEGTITHVDPETMEPDEPIEIPDGADALALDGLDLWILSRNAGLVTPVVEGEIRPPIRVGEHPTSLATGLGAIWVGDRDGIIRRIDRETRVMTEVPLNASIRDLAPDDEANTLWVDID
jgi:class 3 adenylate cyclase/streptogramin lyase